MKSKKIARILSVLISASVIMPAAQLSCLPAVAAVSVSSSWTIYDGSTSESIPSDYKLAFEKAAASYSGDELVPLACYSIQTVAGYNFDYICRQKGQLKNVTVYQDPQDNCTISSVRDFDLNDYAENHTVVLPEEPNSGGAAVVQGSRCTLPEEVEKPFNKIYEGLCGSSCVPLAYLGKQTTTNGTDYALLCLCSVVVPDPDYYINVIMIHEDTDGAAYVKSSYSLLGTKTYYPVYNGELTYNFSGKSSSESGYAEGTISLHASKSGTYKIYWADDGKALDGYYPIAELKMSSGETKTVKMGYHTVIPANATKIIATTDSLYTEEAYSVFNIPMNKRLSYDSGKYLYSFSTYSDIHIDKGSLWYVNAETNFKQALNYSNKMGTDYIVVSGDCVTNDSGPDKEWDAYAKVLSKSSYVNPVWESDGNHDMRQGVESGLKSFIKGSGTDGSNSNKPYFYMEEKKTGDIFIFMALELDKSPYSHDEFSDEQISWVTNLIEKYKSTRNIFLIQHSPIKGFGAGDRMSKPYYGGMLNQNYSSTKKFKEILTKYPNIVFLSGHTHEDFVMDYNYSDENGTAAYMIHTPSLAGSTMPNSSDTGLERNGGKGFNSQGYYVEVYENRIVFYGANITKEKIYPLYSYVMEGYRTDASPVLKPVEDVVMTGTMTDPAEELSKVYYILKNKYKYASYDSYQALKKYYYRYSESASVDTAVIEHFEKLIEDLSKYTGDVSYHSVNGTYYFVNNKKWDKVYAYAWTGSSSNATWPGTKLEKVGTNSYNEDVYAVQFKDGSEYQNIIFNAGSNSKQTVDISLSKYQFNGFYISGTDNGKFTVKNFDYDPKGKDTIALLYYVSNEHGWANVDTFLKCGSDGIYRGSYEAYNNVSFSCSLYNQTTDKYLSLSESNKFAYADGLKKTITLESMSSRGKSITVQEMSEGDKLEFAYDPSTKKITVTCAEKPAPVNNTSTINTQTIKAGESAVVSCSANGGSGSFTYKVSYSDEDAEVWTPVNVDAAANQAVVAPTEPGKYIISVVAADSNNTISSVSMYLTVTENQVQEKLINISYPSTHEFNLGETITLYGLAVGGSAPYKYAFLHRASGSSTWKVIGTKFGDADTAKFKPSKKGRYELLISVKDSSGTTVSSKLYVDAIDPTELENTSSVNTTNASCGTKIVLTGCGNSGKAPYSYTYQYMKPNKTTWYTIGEKYGTAETASFNTKLSGTYKARVIVKDANGTVKTKSFSINVTGTLLKNESVISAWGIPVNGNVVVTAKTSGGTEPFFYTYERKKVGDSKWTLIGTRNSSKTSITYSPKAAGDYQIRVLIKDISGYVASKTFTIKAADE